MLAWENCTSSDDVAVKDEKLQDALATVDKLEKEKAELQQSITDQQAKFSSLDIDKNEESMKFVGKFHQEL